MAELETDEQACLPRGTPKKSVVADAGEAFGQDMQQPAPNEFVWMQGHGGGPLRGAACP